ncbi:serine/threonine-protein kinase [Actinophytocola sediminis]
MTQQPEQVTYQRVIAGRYAVLQEIGRGGMGIVWLAEDRMIGRQVAIKELHLPAGVPPEERLVLEERVLREARAAGRLNDPAVVTVYDVLQEAGNTFIVMELIKAPTLSAIVAQQGPLPQDAVARLAEQLMSALEAAHAAGIVHRDVKPSNIMVSANGRVKLTDFGIAQSTDDPRLTTSGVLVGSPSYIAPERIRGGEADPGSDLWALAAVLYFAVEGHSPFERSSTAATMHAILNEVPYLTRSQGPLASVIMGLLNTVPEARLSVDQVRGLLAHANATPPAGTRAMGPGVTYAAPALLGHPPARGGRKWVLVGLVGMLLAGLAGGWFTAQAINAEAVDPAKGPTMTYGRGGQIEEFAIDDEECSAAELAAGKRFPSSSRTDCAEPHEFEVVEVDVFDTSDLDYLGEDVLTRYAEATCAMVFASDLVANRDKAVELRYSTLLPSSKSWDDAANDDSTDGGDRAIKCVLTSQNGGQLEQTQLLQQE